MGLPTKVELLYNGEARASRPSSPAGLHFAVGNSAETGTEAASNRRIQSVVVGSKALAPVAAGVPAILEDIEQVRILRLRRREPEDPIVRAELHNLTPHSELNAAADRMITACIKAASENGIGTGTNGDLVVARTLQLQPSEWWLIYAKLGTPALLRITAPKHISPGAGWRRLPDVDEISGSEMRVAGLDCGAVRINRGDRILAITPKAADWRERVNLLLKRSRRDSASAVARQIVNGELASGASILDLNTERTPERASLSLLGLREVLEAAEDEVLGSWRRKKLQVEAGKEPRLRKEDARKLVEHARFITAARLKADLERAGRRLSTAQGQLINELIADYPAGRRGKPGQIKIIRALRRSGIDVERDPRDFGRLARLLGRAATATPLAPGAIVSDLDGATK